MIWVSKVNLLPIEAMELEESKWLCHTGIIHFAPCSKRIIAEVSNLLFDMGEVSGETIFIDGTMIEANANKYTFVWKKAVTKNQAKLLIKIADFVAECEQLYDIKIVYQDVVKIKYVKKLRKKLYALKESEEN